MYSLLIFFTCKTRAKALYLEQQLKGLITLTCFWRYENILLDRNFLFLLNDIIVFWTNNVKLTNKKKSLF